MIGWAEVDAMEEDGDGVDEGDGASAVERLVVWERDGEDHLTRDTRLSRTSHP
jgi:hypothetical protein